MVKISKLWVDKHAPKILDDYIFQTPAHKQILSRIVADRDIPHLLLTGGPGSGKSTISRMLVDLLGIDPGDVKVVNASDHTGVDFIRNEISSFASTMPNGDVKIIRLEEFDYLTPNSQGLLRGLMDTTSDTCRFICTANYEHKIIAPIKSRFQHLMFTAPNREDVLIRVVEILTLENIDFDLEILEKFVDSAYPDIRSIINKLQINAISGKLLEPTKEKALDYKFELLNILQAGSFTAARKVIAESAPVEDYEEIYKFLYQNIHRIDKLKDAALEASALIILNDAQYKHKVVGVPELNMDSCLASLQQLIK